MPEQNDSVSVVDLFAGIGALTLGFRRAGATIELAVEANETTASSYAANNPDVPILVETIDDDWSLKRILGERGINPTLLVGGPPCRGWSSLGARSSDARRSEQNSATWNFTRLVAEVRPPAFLLENVAALERADGGDVFRSLVTTLEDGGRYVVSHKTLRAVDFGVPQLRARKFVVGLRADLTLEAFEFPQPFSSDPVTVEQAIGDLPTLMPGGAMTRYEQSPRTSYQSRMRNGVSVLTWHRAPTAGATIKRILPHLQPGQSLRDLPVDIRPETGFHNTYGRLDGDAPASAVTGSIGRISSGRHAHPSQNRALTPREAARLQSIPDSFQFKGNQWEVYRQVGDAVPPLLAEAVAGAVIHHLTALRPERSVAEVAHGE